MTMALNIKFKNVTPLSQRDGSDQGNLAGANPHEHNAQNHANPVITRVAPPHKSAGFSLIEFVVSMVILSVISIGVMLFTNPIIDLWSYQKFQQNQAAETRLALMRMCREMNQLKDKTSVIQADSSTFKFTDTGNQTITYFLDSGSLKRTTGTLGQGKVLAKDITGLTFTYYGSNSAAIASPVVSPSDTDLRRIEILLTVTSGGRTDTMRSQAFPRNVTV